MPYLPIREFVISYHRLDPHQTELSILVWLDELTPTSIVRGKLVGPTSVYTSTVEIAYPLREVSRGEHIEMRVTIPEPSWWEPQKPFLYEGALELWDDGQICMRSPIKHGIRNLQLTTKGLKLNGRSFTLRGKEVDVAISEAEMKQLHDAGINGLMITLRSERDWNCSTEFWYRADRYGFLVICCAHDDWDSFHFEINASVFVCPFACVEFWSFEGEIRVRQPLDIHQGWNKPSFGVAWNGSALPSDAAFLLCRDSQLPTLGQTDLPKIVLVDRLLDQLPSTPDVIGWFEQMPKA